MLICCPRSTIAVRPLDGVLYPCHLLQDNIGPKVDLCCISLNAGDRQMRDAAGGCTLAAEGSILVLGGSSVVGGQHCC